MESMDRLDRLAIAVNRELPGLRAAAAGSDRSVLRVNWVMLVVPDSTVLQAPAELRVNGGKMVLMVRQAPLELPLQEQLHQSQVLQGLYRRQL